MQSSSKEKERAIFVEIELASDCQAADGKASILYRQESLQTNIIVWLAVLGLERNVDALSQAVNRYSV